MEAHISATKNLSYQEQTSLGKKKTNPKDNKKCTPQRSLHKSHQSVQDYIHKKEMKLLEKGPKIEIKTDQIRDLEILNIDTDLAIDRLKNKEEARQARLECIQAIKNKLSTTDGGREQKIMMEER